MSSAISFSLDVRFKFRLSLQNIAGTQRPRAERVASERSRFARRAHCVTRKNLTFSKKSPNAFTRIKKRPPHQFQSLVFSPVSYSDDWIRVRSFRRHRLVDVGLGFFWLDKRTGDPLRRRCDAIFFFCFDFFLLFFGNYKSGDFLTFFWTLWKRVGPFLLPKKKSKSRATF